MRVVALVGLGCLAALPAYAYTATGDRIFQSNLLTPQIAPSDEFYVRPTVFPRQGDEQLTNLGVVYDKTITENFGVEFEYGYNWLDLRGLGTATGFQNLETTLRYIVTNDFDAERIFTIGLSRQWGRSGAKHAGAGGASVTSPVLYYGKGLKELADYFKPLAIKGSLAYEISDNSSTRPNQLITSLALEYSIPYLQSKVRAFALSGWINNLIPQIEFQVVTPTSGGRGTSAIAAPGFIYSGEGWELGIEALLPISNAGSGVGGIAQLHFALDFFFTDTIGRPLFSRR